MVDSLFPHLFLATMPSKYSSLIYTDVYTDPAPDNESIRLPHSGHSRRSLQCSEGNTSLSRKNWPMLYWSGRGLAYSLYIQDDTTDLVRLAILNSDQGPALETSPQNALHMTGSHHPTRWKPHSRPNRRKTPRVCEERSATQSGGGPRTFLERTSGFQMLLSNDHL